MLPQNMPFRHKDYSELNVNKKKQMQEKLCSQLPLSPPVPDTNKEGQDDPSFNFFLFYMKYSRLTIL